MSSQNGHHQPCRQAKGSSIRSPGRWGTHSGSTSPTACAGRLRKGDDIVVGVKTQIAGVKIRVWALCQPFELG